MKIAITTFALRNWEPGSSGTLIEGIAPEELVAQCQRAVEAGAPLIDGYAPFCKHLFLNNRTPTRCGFAAITDDNRNLLRSGYLRRREGELAVLERWFEGLAAPVANHFDVILYSRAQLAKEAAEFPDDGGVPDGDWGIVSIIGTLEAAEPPMPPITQLRNALGRDQGGSGVAIDPERYEKAVAFWDRHAAVR
jgi:Protein of unknown function (DUF3228)